MTTIGQLVSDLFTKFEGLLHNERLAAIATQATIDEVLRSRALAARRTATSRA